MKLKKIASVALAGVMAVSVLAGCGADNGANSGNTNTETTSTSIVDAVNNGQTATNLVKIDFTDDATLDNALKTAVEKLGLTATGDKTGNQSRGTVATAVTNMTGLTTVTPKTASQWTSMNLTNVMTVNGVTSGELLAGAVKYDKHSDGTIGDQKDKTYTIYGVLEYDPAQYPTEESVLNSFAASMDSYIAKLAATSDDNDLNGKLDAQITTGDTYYTYTYTANVSMASYTQTNGSVKYYIAYVINQDVGTAKL